LAKKAIGLIETYGYIGSIKAADACLKAANVELIGCEFVRAGLVAIKITGDVGAVQAAIDAGRGEAEKISVVISTHVIANPADEVRRMLEEKSKGKHEVKKEAEIASEVVNEKKSKENKSGPKLKNGIKKEIANVLDGKFEQKIKNNKKESSFNTFSKDELDKIKVVDLRKLARELDNIALEKNRIKFAKKIELIGAILEVKERAGENAN